MIRSAALAVLLALASCAGMQAEDPQTAYTNAALLSTGAQLLLTRPSYQTPPQYYPSHTRCSRIGGSVICFND